MVVKFIGFLHFYYFLNFNYLDFNFNYFEFRYYNIMLNYFVVNFYYIVVLIYFKYYYYFRFIYCFIKDNHQKNIFLFNNFLLIYHSMNANY